MLRWLKEIFAPKRYVPPAKPAVESGDKLTPFDSWQGRDDLRFGTASLKSPLVEPHLYGEAWQRHQTTGPMRLVIGADTDRIGLLLELASLWHGNYYLLYVLIDKWDNHEAGRYQSPPLDNPELKALFSEFSEFFSRDGRHQIWIGSPQGEGLLVFDHHDLIYAYGEIERYEAVLEQRQFVKDAVEVPYPHSHRFHPEWNDRLDRLMKRYEWRRSELQPGDDPGRI